MEALKELFGTGTGLLSVFTIGAATLFIIFMYRFVKRRMDEDAKNAAEK
ncbi:MAG: DUF3149 domain-containing protein [Sulfuritalea sp.]|nr:DUF3149 domain-containing protein [Sulfuritalea sp.]